MCEFPKRITTFVPSISLGGVPRIINLDVPCGKCIECKKQRANDWSFRLEQEQKAWEHTAFITLTYNNENLPVYCNGRVEIGRYNRGLSTLKYSDVQLFFKRLRHVLGKFKFFGIGEYGYNGTLRPHYHIILFYNGSSPERIRSTISEVWSKGRISCECATSGRFSYVCNYCSGGCVGFDNRYERPKMHCSNRLPIGYNWLHSSLAQLCFERGQEVINRSYINKDGERITYKFRIPRFYLRKMDMTKSYEDLLLSNHESFIQSYYGIPDVMCTSPDGTMSVSQSYYMKCKQAYDHLKKSHDSRDVEQHIKFDFPEWWKSFHEFVPSCHKSRFCHNSRFFPSPPLLEFSNLC